MRALRARALLGFAATLMLASPGLAADVVTPLLRKQSGNDFRCLVYNASTKPIDVTIQIWDPVTVAGLATTTRTIQPERSTSVASELAFVATCRVSGRFSKKKTLVTLCVAPPGTAECSVAVTAP